MEDSPVWIGFPSWGMGAIAAVLIGIVLLLILAHTVRPKFLRLHGGLSLPYSLINIPPSIIQLLYQIAVLVLVLLPWWWASVLSAHLVNRLWIDGLNREELLVTPTFVFLAGIVILYLAFLIRGFARGDNPKFRHLRAADGMPPEQPKRVAVIGAGMAGLVTAKELKEEGHQVVVYERTSGWGGVWAESKERGGRAWGSTMTSTGALNSTFSDCPVPIHNAENGDTPLHFTRQQFYDMLQLYNDRYQVLDGDLITNTEVARMEALPDDRWRLHVRHTSGELTSGDFDAVTICTGLNHEPWTPDFEGVGSFAGEELHVNDYDSTNPGKYKGKRVLIVGIGETAADLALDLYEHGVEHVYASPRNSTLTLARNIASAPPDYVESRLVYSGPMFNRWALLILSIPQMVTNLVRPSRVPSHRGRYFFQLLRPNQTLRAFPSVLGSVNTTKSDNLWHVLDRGKASVVGEIAAITPTGATLTDGSTVEVDAVIYCTGYRTKNSFLPPLDEGLAQADSAVTARELYKLTIHPHLPNVAMIGFARGLIGAITVSTEMQARWWSLILSGKRLLPDRETMIEDINYLRDKSRRFGQPTRTTMTFANSIARNEVGCEPDMFTLFRTDRRLWWQLWNGVMCNAQYRIHGVGAKPELARRQLLMPYALHDPDYRDVIDMFYNVIPLQLLLIPIWDLIERLVPSFATRSALTSYV